MRRPPQTPGETLGPEEIIPDLRRPSHTEGETLRPEETIPTPRRASQPSSWPSWETDNHPASQCPCSTRSPSPASNFPREAATDFLFWILILAFQRPGAGW